LFISQKVPEQRSARFRLIMALILFTLLIVILTFIVPRLRCSGQ